MSGRHQMPKHETRNTRNTRITWEVKHSLVMKFGQFMYYYKIKFLSKNYMKNVAWKLIPGPFKFSKNPL